MEQIFSKIANKFLIYIFNIHIKLILHERQATALIFIGYSLKTYLKDLTYSLKQLCSCLYFDISKFCKNIYVNNV